MFSINAAGVYFQLVFEMKELVIMDFLKENEQGANKAAAKVMAISEVLFVLVLVLNMIGVFTVKPMVMLFAFVVGSILLLIPTVLVLGLKQRGGWVKYVIVLCAVIFTVILTITLAYHVVLLYVYPVAIASLYFSKRLNIFATGLTVIGVSVGQIISYRLDLLTDHNFDNMGEAISIGVLPRGFVLFAVSAILPCSVTARHPCWEI